MKFSDLSARKARDEKPKAAAAKPAPVPAPQPAAEPAPPELPREEAKSPSVSPGAASPVPQTAPLPAPAGPAITGRTRREQQRKDEATARKGQRPFKELDAEAKDLYSRNIDAAGELLAQIDGPYVEKYDKLARLSGLTARALADNPALLAYTVCATGGNYLQAHSANVAMISQAMGIALKLGRDELVLLGFCGMAHDIGMTGCLEIANSEDKLSDDDFARITLHSAEGAEKVDRIIDIDYKIKERAARIISQVHERVDGSGYPARLSGEAIDMFAQVIGAADVYEAMSHPRPWREAYHPHNAVKHLIDKEGKGFDSKAVKALMEAVTLYPPGSLVCLSTGEIARVLMPNKGSLTRPVVETLLSATYEPVAPQMVDLMEYPLTAIERIVELDEIARKNQKYAAKLELARWWVEW